jgi:hypothetical protein
VFSSTRQEKGTHPATTQEKGKIKCRLSPRPWHS